MNVSIVKLRLRMEVLEGFMITVDNGRMAHAIVAPFSECLFDGKQFTVMCWIATLQCVQLLAIVAYQQQ